MARKQGSRKSASKDGVVASGARGLGTGIIGTLFANQVRASAGKAGLAGLAAGVAFNMLMRRTPAGAMLLGGAMLAHQAYKKGQATKARRSARRALAVGATQAPGEPNSVSYRPAKA